MSDVSAGQGDAGAPKLSHEHLLRVCEFLYRRTGMTYGESKRYYIERRIAERMARNGSVSVPAYLQFAQGNARETEELINSFTVNETYFYREEHQFRCLGADLLPEIVGKRGPGDLVRLWSVPCSTGEEPYSLAIWLLENWRLVDAYNIEIVGSDIDTDALATAAHGAFGERSLARLPSDVRERYFGSPLEGQRQIIRDLRESVRYTPVNLIDGAAMAAQGMFDVIFCRNVLIYFDEASRRRAAEHLFAALRPGGFICLGHTESMSRIDDRFTVRRFDEAIVYQRPAV